MKKLMILMVAVILLMGYSPANAADFETATNTYQVDDIQHLQGTTLESDKPIKPDEFTKGKKKWKKGRKNLRKQRSKIKKKLRKKRNTKRSRRD